MKIGIPTEIKVHEYRIGMVPGSVRELIKHGHSVVIQAGAGLGIGFADPAYQDAGATIVTSREEVFAQADMIVKVKEPQPEECALLREDQILFTFLHIAAEPKLATWLQESGCVAIAYETVTDQHGGLPLLAPMSEVAGRISIQIGAHYLEKQQQGRGILLGGVPGVSAGQVVIIGGGVVGSNAVKIALGLGAKVTVLDKSLAKLRDLEHEYGAQITTLFATEDRLHDVIPQADLVIGAVLVPGAEAPKVVSRRLIASMQPGTVVIDVAIDQGGCLETSTPTNFSNPTYVVEQVIHCCITNLPGSVPRTSTFSLNNATLPFIIDLANNGYKQAMLQNPNLLAGLNVYHGKITHHAIAEVCKQNYFPAVEALV